MKIYFAGPFGSSNREFIEVIADEKWPTYLFSYAYPQLIKEALPMGVTDLIIDSGAFSLAMAKQPRKIDISEYANFIKGFRERWPHQVEFINLDVIGDQEASNRNHTILRTKGCDTIPVLHFGAEESHLIEMLDSDHEIVALGGLVPYARRKKTLHEWLDKCFSLVVERWQDTGRLQKIHILGISGESTLNRYPIYSCDASTWASIVMFGHSKHIDEMPRTNEEARELGSMKVIRVALRKYLHDTRALQERVTRRWESRGVVWN